MDVSHLHDPSRYRAETTLRDGTRVSIRAIRPSDHEAEAAFAARLSDESRYSRFFHAKQALTEAEVRYFTEIDFRTHVALVATRPDTPEQPILAVGRYVATKDSPPGSAEIAFAVDDALHGLGIATILLDHLAAIARANGFTEFRATVLAMNRAMLDVFAHCGLPRRSSLEAGVNELVLDLQGAPEAPGTRNRGTR